VLNFRNIRQQAFAKRDKQFIFAPAYFFFRVQHRLFEFLQFLIDVALRVDQRLLAHVGVRHQRGVGFGHFDIVAEHAVVADFEGMDARGLPLFDLQRGNPFFAVGADGAQAIQLFVKARGDKSPVLRAGGRIGDNRAGKQRNRRGHVRHVFAQGDQSGRGKFFQPGSQAG